MEFLSRFNLDSSVEEIRVLQLAAGIQRLRPTLAALVTPIVGREMAEDVIQDVFLRLENRARTGSEEIEDALIVAAARNLAIDYHRREKWLSYSSMDSDGSNGSSRKQDRKTSESHCPPSPDFESEEIIVDLSPLERKVFQFRHGLHRSHSEIAQELKRSEAAIRKMYQRAKEKVQARVYYLLVNRGDFRSCNIPRITLEQARRIGELCLGDASTRDNLFSVFESKELNQAIQNSTWILAALTQLGSESTETIESFLVEQLHRGDLYRGNKNYLAEALLDINYRRYIFVFRRDFLLKMQEFEDRVTRQNLGREEAAQLTRPCLFDLKSIRPIGYEVRSQEAQQLLKTYLSGQGSLDYRRCLAFQLLRIHPSEERYAHEVIRWLEIELDQINAYYIAKYLRTVALPRRFPPIEKTLLRAVQKAAERWTSNQYLADTERILARKV